MAGTSGDDLPVKDIPGGYGIPFFSAVRDRFDFHYNAGGNDGFFQDRVNKYQSTVFRTNIYPGPFMASDPKVITLLDASSFPVLFDVDKVEKRDVFTGTYMPPLSLTGGFRVCSYLDPSEPNHAKNKQLLFNLLSSRKDHLIPEFRTTFSILFNAMDDELANSGESDLNKLIDVYGFEYLCTAYFGVPPSSTPLGINGGADQVSKWLLFNLHPVMTLGLGLPKFLEDLLLHTFHLPPFLVKSHYQAVYEYFNSNATAALDICEKLGLSREEACHNLLFATCFNSYGGIKVMFPSILQFLATYDDASSLHAKLAAEIRSAVEEEGGNLTFSALERMELTKSVVYEALRMDPPVKFQYGKAKRDLVVSSHDASFQVQKGEMLFGYQPFATRDEKVFENGNKFVPDRFVGDAGQSLLKYVLWSNGPETESPSTGNKQCAGKNFVVLMGRLLVAELFLHYDTFTADVSKLQLGKKITVTSATKRTDNA